MKKYLLLFLCCLGSMVIFTACDNGQPYNQYSQAYQKLQTVDSFILESTGSLIQSRHVGDIVDENHLEIKQTYHILKDDAEYLAISNMIMKLGDEKPTVADIYFCNGYEYCQDKTDSTQSYRTKIDKDFALKAAIEGIIIFPKNVIDKQVQQDTTEGTLLTFILDSKKYYAYHDPETYKQYGYGGFSTYRESPVYTVLLDKQGRIKKVTGHFCEVNSDNTEYTRDQSYEITFTQYGGVELEFPELNDKDYPEMQKPSSE